MPLPAMTSPATWSPQSKSQILKGMLLGAGALTAPQARLIGKAAAAPVSSEDIKPPYSVRDTVITAAAGGVPAAGGVIGVAGSTAYGVRGFNLARANRSRIQNRQVLEAGLREVKGDVGTRARLQGPAFTAAVKRIAARGVLRRGVTESVPTAYAALGPELARKVNWVGLNRLGRNAWVSPLGAKFTPAGAPLKASIVPRNPFKTIRRHAGLGGLIGGLAGAAGVYALGS